MTAAIVCPGPSLATCDPRDISADVVIGVNRGIKYVPCDCWAFTDFARFCDPDLIESIDRTPELLTNESTVNLLTVEADERLRRHRIVTHESLLPTVPPSIDWPKYTACAALVYAASKARTILCYGVDHSDAADFDGHRYHKFLDPKRQLTIRGDDRSESRWRKEIPIWNDLVEWLGKQGVTVNRIHPEKING